MKVILALLADWANGIFAILLAAYVTGTEIAWWHFVVGILLAHSPDIDALPEFLKRGKVSASAEHPHDHRAGFHYPLVVLPLLGVLAYLFGYWGWVVLMAVGLHFINDVYGTGWGVKLFWPFSNRNYKILTRRVNQPKYVLLVSGVWDTLPESERKLQLLASWNAEELSHYIQKWGMDDWIDELYLRLNWVSCTEYSLAILAFILMIFSLVY